MPTYGIKAAQFIDLIGYIVIKSSSNAERTKSLLQCIIDLFQQQNLALATHPNSTIYSQLANLVEFDGFYLENDP